MKVTLEALESIFEVEKVDDNRVTAIVKGYNTLDITDLRRLIELEVVEIWFDTDCDCFKAMFELIEEK